MGFDVAIVGAGIVGAACAASLSSAGLSVVVIDASGVATGTTAAGMGHIVVMDDSEAQFALTNYSQKLWNDLAPQLPKTSEYEHCGTIWVAADDAEMATPKDHFGVLMTIIEKVMKYKTTSPFMNELAENMRQDFWHGMNKEIPPHKGEFYIDSQADT